MHILTVGINYKKTPVHIREKFAIPINALTEALQELRQTKSILECVIVSTCNRTEVYAVVDQLHTGRYYIKRFLSETFDIQKEVFEPFLDIKENDEAVQHIFEVPVGLDSMILGETQILGQIKEAFFTAQEAGTTGTIFNMLFKQVITTAKKAHAETDIGQNAVSVSYAAIELGKKVFGDLSAKKVLILGAGKMSELTVKHLNANGVSEVFVVNRTYERAVELAQKFNGQAYDYSQLDQCLQQVDIVISSTGANHYVMTKQQIEDMMSARHDHPLFLIDIAVPRDLDPAIHEVENAFLYDIDDLNGIVNANLEERKKEAVKIQEMIAIEMDEFSKWLNTLGVVPVITALRQKALSIQEETVQSILNKCPDLDEREEKVIRKHTKSIVNQMLRDPITRVKELAGEPGARDSLDLVTEIFALEEEIKEQEKIERAQQLAKRIDKKQKAYKEQAVRNELPAH
ncbi:glutamyl-tRNA reductase [Caldalkalibacillus salinus]|uniref:glutamyl-tRNA reductase n=1 Tax=Caldalkalibacillus salinus TaxID=2803787 RepID=UPI0019228377|nr:glutamyl-tRNA reductase [Caldalkalibacillus salinus]